MIKTLAVAALLGGLVAAPVAPVQAATFGPNCLFFPLLQADCRAAISEAFSMHKAAVTKAATAAMPDYTDPKRGPRLAFWWMVKCTPAAAGAGHLLDC